MFLNAPAHLFSTSSFKEKSRLGSLILKVLNLHNKWDKVWKLSFIVLSVKSERRHADYQRVCSQLSVNVWFCRITTILWTWMQPEPNFTAAKHSVWHTAVSDQVSSYLSMMTGSDGVSLRFPQLFLSQHRLWRKKRIKKSEYSLIFIILPGPSMLHFYQLRKSTWMHLICKNAPYCFIDYSPNQHSWAAKNRQNHIRLDTRTTRFWGRHHPGNTSWFLMSFTPSADTYPFLFIANLIYNNYKYFCLSLFALFVRRRFPSQVQ